MKGRSEKALNVQRGVQPRLRRPPHRSGSIRMLRGQVSALGVGSLAFGVRPALQAAGYSHSMVLGGFELMS